nr:hypothetical protein IMFVHALQ_IMFVHALQ_CDS_0004 [Microvirus sp.]
MKYRKKMSRRGSRKLIRSARRTKVANIHRKVSRGGIRF